MAEHASEPEMSRVCVCHSRQEVEQLIKETEGTTQCKYVSVCNNKSFNNMEWQPSAKNRVFFEKKNDGKSPTIPFSGMPFIFIGSMSFECHLGKDRAKKKKERYAQNMVSGDQVHKKRRFLAQDTKKIGCPAELKVTRVATFPDHKIEKDSVWERKNAGQALRRLLQENKLLVWENTYYVLLPRLEDHIGHPVLGEVACVQKAANPRVEERIKELLKQGVTSVSEMCRRVREFVKGNLVKGEKPPPVARYRYYTLHQNLRNIMKSAWDAVLHSGSDQEKLQILAQTWTETDPGDIFVRPHCASEGFLLCYQSKWQQRLLHLYGQHCCLLDAAFKLTRHELPLFFLWVRTNVCYVVAAVFVVQHETKEAVSEALHVLKTWNEGWSPGYFMVDFSMAEINAVESVFTDCKAVLCDFHREKAWLEWMKNVDHGVLNQDEALASLKRIAAVGTLQEYKQAFKQLQESEEWTRNPLFQTWLQTTWLPEEKRWASVFREEALQNFITTNNGLERLNETFQYRPLKNCKTSTMSEIMTVIVNDFIPQWQKKYTQLNIQYSSGYKHSDSIHNFLHNRPCDMVMHILDRMTADLGPDSITEMSYGTFKVTSESDRESHVVTLGSSSTLPSCTCEDWKRNRLPCKHFCAGFKAGWTWDVLCPQYRDNPLFTLDPVCRNSSPPVSLPGEEILQGQDHEAEIKEKDVEDQGNKILLQDDAALLQELPTRTKTIKTVNTTRRRCIERLKAISDAVISVDNEDFLQSLEITLEDMAMEVKEYIPHDKRMALNNFTKSRKRKSTVVIHNAVPLLKRVYRCPKQLYTNRLSVPAEITKKVPVHVTNPLPTNSLLSVDQSNTTPLLELDLETSDHTKTQAWCTVEGTVLSFADRNVLLTGQPLNDKHINASQSLLREEFPFLEGLTDTAVISTAAEQVPATAEAIQIHHIDQHWLVSTSARGQVQLYDSLLPGSCIPLTLRQQLATVYRRYCRGQDGIIDVHMKCTQQEQQAVDCGLFAIANAVSLASGFDPADIQYNQNMMRGHLHTCLIKGKLKMFPHTQRKSSWTIAERHAMLSKYCICHLYKEKADMVQCDRCQGWYHYSCVNITASTVEQMMTIGYCCPNCDSELVPVCAGSVEIV
uniref:COP9 signalosome complex subunit 9 isoform X1 n=1 Tax=Monopterus albus TaxID=43700 RepID=UPI0009B2F760|nr:COP9 signalosome complex subunit 9 isoform X1 [Monopterus albus]XP_020447012.1 COP9 signalosome complex subunit 9 isoform X1 [Monopterus albus]